MNRRTFLTSLIALPAAIKASLLGRSEPRILASGRQNTLDLHDAEFERCRIDPVYFIERYHLGAYTRIGPTVDPDLKERSRLFDGSLYPWQLEAVKEYPRKHVV